MAEVFPALTAQHRRFIARQHIFFTASSAAHGHINLSPKDAKALRILDDATICYLDLTGSGNETAAHLLADGRLTVMFCAFEGPPLILRLYGHGRILARGEASYDGVLASAFGGAEPPGARQIMLLDITRVQTSCGYGVPFYAYRGERDGLVAWAEKKGEEGLAAYRAEKNVLSIDGLPTGLPASS
jgi:hypothetical protein